jgi:hypothetical protein
LKKNRKTNIIRRYTLVNQFRLHFNMLLKNMLKTQHKNFSMSVPEKK